MAYTPPALPYYGPVAHDSGNGNLPINRIVIHYTAGDDATGAQGTARYFRDPAATGSAHYITDSDESIQCAHDDIIAWHAPPNQHSLGIEMECSGVNGAKGHWVLPNHVAMMHRTAKLTAQKAIQYGVPIVKLSVADLLAGKRGICGHVDVSNAFHQSTHTDPGPYFPWTEFMTWVHEEAAAITGGTPTPPPPEVWNMATGDEILAWLKADAATSGTSGQRYSALQNSINAVGGAVNSTAAALASLVAQVKAEDVADDADLAAKTSALAKSLADMNTELQKVEALVTPPATPAPKA